MWRNRRSSDTEESDALPGPIRFYYRRSPRPLIPHAELGGVPWMLGPREVGRVGRDNPPLTVSGMVSVVLDSRGRLLILRAVPPQLEAVASPPPKVDWPALFAEAGLEAAAFTPTRPEWAATVASDAKLAWEGRLPGAPDVPVRIEAASYHGRPVSFEILGPWARASRMGPLESWTLPALRAALWIYLILGAFVVVGGAALARRHLLRGRGDRHGALRLGMFVFASLGLAQIAHADHVLHAFAEYHLLERMSTYALAWAVFAAMMYLALEPLVRRRWPRILTSWHRLLAGSARDPMVGRDLLIGSLAGLGLLWFGASAGGSEARLSVAAEPRQLVYLALATPFRAIATAIATLLLILLAHLIVRRRWLALTLAGLAYVFPAIGPTREIWRAAPAAIAGAAIVVGVVFGFGLLAAVAAWFVKEFAGALPPISDPSVWYAGPTLVGTLLLGALIVYGFSVSLGERPVLIRLPEG